MPPRRPHSKSRLGCKQCKQRRVKCDEKGPICYNCNRRGFDCSFKYSGAPKRPQNLLDGNPISSYPHTAVSSPGAWSASTPSKGAFSRQTELELIHQYAVSSYDCLWSLAPEDVQRMKVELVQWGLNDHPFLLDSIMSLAALHLSSLRPEEATRYGDIAVAYQERALTSFREIILNPRPDQCPAIFYASAIIGLTAFALPRFHPAHRETSPTTTLLNLSRLLSGTVVIMDVAMDIMGPEDFHRIFPESPKPDRSKIESDVQDVLNQLRVLAAEADERLRGTSSDPEADHESTYLHAVGLLDEYLQTVHMDPDVVPEWIVRVGTGFCALLEQGDPLAQLITLCYTVLMHKTDARWWANGAAVALADELAVPVSAQCQEWADIATWAKAKLSVAPVGMTPPKMEAQLTF